MKLAVGAPRLAPRQHADAADAGIWDCQSSQAVVEFVRRGIASKQPLDKICENLMDNCLSSSTDTGGVGCDNMTMIIIGFLNGKTKEEWYEEIARRVKKGDGPCAPPEYGMSAGPCASREPCPLTRTS